MAQHYDFFGWMEATNPRAKGVNLREALRRTELRARVMDRAKTTANTLRVAKARGHIGDGLLQRMVDATAGEEHCIAAQQAGE